MPSSVESSPARRNPIITTSDSTTTASAAAGEMQCLTSIPLIYDSLTFDARQEKWIKDLERKVSVPLTLFRVHMYRTCNFMPA